MKQGGSSYRGRIAPSPTGLLHKGHAKTFHIAWKRAKEADGTILLRNDDLDHLRCKPEFIDAMKRDLLWLGLDWDEGPGKEGLVGPYSQSERRASYIETMNLLMDKGCLYPCFCSRRDIQNALSAPHEGDDEPVYPGTCRCSSTEQIAGWPDESWNPKGLTIEGRRVSWRFRVQDGAEVSFKDGGFGEQRYIAGKDFGDFVVWRSDDFPAYHLAVVSDDHRMGITEVVRGEDLLRSTARQILLYQTLGWKIPEWYHCPLVRDDKGERLAKRSESQSIQAFRETGRSAKRVWVCEFEI